MAVKTFTTGEVLTASDTNTYLANAGLVYITATTVGSAVSSVTVSNVFSSTYANYKIIWSGGYGSNNGTGLKMTVSGATGSTYNYGGYYTEYSTATLGGSGAAGSAAWVVGEVSTVALTLEIDVFQPEVTSAYTHFTGWSVGHQYARTMHGHDTSASVSTGFTITPNAGTLTGGTIRVYGYRQA